MESSSSDVKDYRSISITPVLSKVFEKIVFGKLSIFLESDNLLPFSRFLYRRDLETCDALLTLSQYRQVAVDGGVEEMLIQLGILSCIL